MGIDSSSLVRLSSFVGLTATTVIVTSVVSQRPMACSSSGGCNDFLWDSWSHIGLFHFAYAGLCVHLVIFLSAGSKTKWQRHLALWLAGGGTLFSAALMAHAYELSHFCIWCVLSAVSFIVTLALMLLTDAVARETRHVGRTFAALLMLPLVAALAERSAGYAPSSSFARLEVAPPPLLFLEDSRPTLGPPDGRKVVLFADLTCPYCREIVPRIVAAVRKGAKYRVIFRYLPIESHPYAWEGARCARFALSKNKFWEYFLDGSKMNGVDGISLTKLARRWAGKTVGEIQSKKAIPQDEEIQADVQLARVANVMSTPSVVTAELGGITVMSGEDFLHRIEDGK